MNPHIRPAAAGPALAARFTQMHARHADSRPDSFRAGARQIAALGGEPEKSFRVWTDEGGPGRGYGLGLLRNEGGPGGPLCARRRPDLKLWAGNAGGALTLNLWVGAR